MATLLQKLRVAWWYLERPRLYPEFARFARRRLRTFGMDREREASEATRLCESLHVDVPSALRDLTGRDVSPLSERFPKDLADARDRLARSGQQMHGGASLDLIFHLAEHLQATRAIETGVSAGWSSLAFLLSLRSRAGAMLVSTDMPYPGSSRKMADVVGCVVPTDLHEYWILIDGPDAETLPKALQRLPEIDICHYDSDKSYDGRMWAYRLLWGALRPGGIMISDDIDDNLGFFHFCGEVNCCATVVQVPASKRPKYVGILTKPTMPRRSESL